MWILSPLAPFQRSSPLPHSSLKCMPSAKSVEASQTIHSAKPPSMRKCYSAKKTPTSRDAAPAFTKISKAEYSRSEAMELKIENRELSCRSFNSQSNHDKRSITFHDRMVISGTHSFRNADSAIQWASMNPRNKDQTCESFIRTMHQALIFTAWC